MRIQQHPILGDFEGGKKIEIFVDGEKINCYKGEMIAVALMENGKRVFRYTKKEKRPRGVFCAIGRCTDCVMKVNGVPNVRTCITRVEEGMKIETQKGCGEWNEM